MAVRFDDESREIRLSVNDLLEREQARSLGFANRGGFERMWLGQAIHSDYQEQSLEQDPSYQREVTVKHHFEYRGWAIELHGRIDGLRRAKDGLLWVEEIKSIRAGQTPSPTTLELYRSQALIYAWILRCQLQGTAPPEAEDDLQAAVLAELVLIEIGTGNVERIVLDLDVADIEAKIHARLNGLLAAHDEQREATFHRREAAERLEFPFYQLRAGQQQIIEQVEQSLAEREHLLVEAPTGLGKTVASLFPVLRYALRHDKKVYVLTAKTLQQDMASDVLDLLNRDDAFRFLRLRAKSKMCANGEVLCHEEYCDYAKDYYQKLQRSGLIRHLVMTRSSLQPDDIYKSAHDSRVCPFEVSLEVGRLVQAMVCDYNYAFDPYVSLTDFSEDNDLSDTILVIDEIHNLVDRGRGYYSPTLSSQRCRHVAQVFRDVAGLHGSAGAALEERIQSLVMGLAHIIEGVVGEVLPPTVADGALETRLPEDALWQIRPEFDRAFVDYLEYRRETRSFRAEDPFVDLYFALLRFLNTLQQANNSAFSHLVLRERGEMSIRLLCKDASRFLGEILNRCHSVVGLSATLSPPDFYRDLLGFDAQRTSVVRVPTPFPRENRAIVIDDTVTTTYRERPANYGPIADRLGQFAEAVPGNCLVLFPSYRFLAEIADRLPVLKKRILIQKRADGERERQELLSTLRSALFGDVLLLAVAGGVFAEGVDYPGDMLRAVAVVGPCLPSLSVEQKLLEGYYNERFEQGFEYAFVVPGMTRVVQAAGRLIRSDHDTGVIALIGERFARSPYIDHLPVDWFDEIDDPRDLCGDPGAVAREFFARVQGPIDGAADLTLDNMLDESQGS